MSVPTDQMPTADVLPFPQQGVAADDGVKRTRERRKSFLMDEARQAEIHKRVLDFYTDDITSRDADRDARLQRYAKFRMWVERKDYPWPDATNIPLSDMLEKSLRAQDTIHNAVMSNRPVINATAYAKADKDKQDSIDSLIDYQVFEEQLGEEMVGQAADAFVNDGVLTVFVPWVREEREVSDVRLFGPIPPGADPVEYFKSLMQQTFATGDASQKSGGWDWTIRRKNADGDEETVEVKFYTKPEVNGQPGEVEMVIRERATVFDGPRPTVLDYDDVLAPARCENLQIPGPSNPGGASHAIILSDPTVDEVRRLQRNGFYDLITAADVDALQGVNPRKDNDQEEIARDNMGGVIHIEPPKGAKSHQTVQRMICFDCYDIDGDGVDEDVVWWICKELPGKVLKAAYLSEIYPSRPPRRPFGEASFIPVRGRRVGISMLEILEGLHDIIKQFMDQAGDAGTLGNTPFFFYRASAGVRPEVIRLQPGEGYPVPNPAQDVSFPTIGNPQAQGFALNMITMLSQMEERAVVIGDAQFGRVPAGRSSAMRTTSNMQMLMGQGEARPERILRRFFLAFSQVWSQIHQLNQHFLPKDKQYRVAGYVKPNQDPYRQVKTRSDIQGRYDFGFRPAVLNTSKEQMRQGLQMMLQTYVNQLALAMGVIDGEGVYRLLRDVGKSWGGDPDSYLKPPNPHAAKRKILAEEAIQAILKSESPEGFPGELGGPREHMQKLAEFMQGDAFGLLLPEQRPLFREWMEIVRQYLAEQMQQEKMAQAMAAFQQAMGGGPMADQGGRPAEGGTDPGGGNPQVSGGGELIDESLPGAGGGAQQ